LEKYGGVGLKAYSYLLEGGKNGPEISELKEYFSCVQLANSQNPETTVIRDYVDVYNVSFLMRAMGYFPSETEVNEIITTAFINGYKKTKYIVPVPTPLNKKYLLIFRSFFCCYRSIS